MWGGVGVWGVGVDSEESRQVEDDVCLVHEPSIHPLPPRSSNPPLHQQSPASLPLDIFGPIRHLALIIFRVSRRKAQAMQRHLISVFI